MTEQHRLAAILVADVVGYSKLIGSDEAGTLTQLQALLTEVIEPQVAQHAGRLFRSVGDGFLIEFASAVQAVTCAKAIQEANATGRLPLRVGIHVGDVVVQGDDYLGDGVNIAARIEGIADPGGIAISRAVHEQVRDRLDLTFADRGEVALKNITRPVQVFALAGAGATPALAPEPALALPDKPSIAVLPFQNMSGDPQQEYFADGVTEDIITELARFHELFVIARNSSFTYKGRSADVRSVAGELGVRYVLEGSIRRSAQRIRVTGQLFDATTGSHIWAERYDRVLEDVFAVQEELTQSIVGAIAPHIRDAEAAYVRRRPGSLGACEFAVRANAKAWEAYAKAVRRLREEATTDARSALAIDPISAIALNAIALAQCQQLPLGTAAAPQAVWQDGMIAATRAIEADRNGNVGYGWKGALLSFAVEDKHRNEAIAYARALELNPGHLEK